METTSQIRRRSFLKHAPVVGASLATAASTAAQDRPPRKPRYLFRVGCLNVSTYSHLPDLWAPLIKPRPGTGDIPFTGMRITHCWDIDPALAEGFAKTFGCQAVKRFDAMLGKVDGVREADLDELADHSVRNSSSTSNPRPMAQADYLAVLRTLMMGC